MSRRRSSTMRRRASPTPSTSPRPTATARTSPSPAAGSRPIRFTVALEEIGDSVLVVGDTRTLKIHVHTDQPEQAIAVLAGAGTVSHLDVADMHAQVAARVRQLSEGARCGVLAVVASTGIGNLFRSLGAHVLDGGPTLNPSTYELLAGIHAVAAEEVVVPPNSLQRDHGSRPNAPPSCRRSRSSSCPRAASRRRWRHSSRCLPRAGRWRTRRRSPSRWPGCATARSHRPRATTPTGASASARRSASSASRWSRGGTPRRRSRTSWRASATAAS